jgi:hypothetical protein
MGSSCATTAPVDVNYAGKLFGPFQRMHLSASIPAPASG